MKMTKEEAFKMLQGKKVYAGEFTKEVQEKLFEIGFKWVYNVKKILKYNFIFISENDFIYTVDNLNAFLEDKIQEITISQILGIELEQEFNDGDICCGSNGNCEMVFIYKSEKEPYRYYFHACITIKDGSTLLNDWCVTNGNIRFATKEECDTLFDAINKGGYKWNAEEKKLEKKRWRANKGEKYYCIDESVCVYGYIKYNDNNDDMYYNAHNYFQTEQEAQEYADKIKKLLKNR